jgi:hypothetical protein
MTRLGRISSEKRVLADSRAINLKCDYDSDSHMSAEPPKTVASLALAGSASRAPERKSRLIW